jgi:NAD(P)-dependent dehydrogenase (short-subunit alcohol dehydrogenase family)
MTGKTVLITGANRGIGLEAARALAKMGAHVVVGARDRARGQAAVDAISKRGGSAELLEIDMSSFASVRAAARRFAAGHPALDVLVNNAGIVTRTRQLTADGHEIIWATNFLGPFLLTRELLPTLKRASHPRVVSVSSAAHFGAQIPWDDVELEHGFRPFKAYAQSKLAQVLFTRELARREPAIAATAVHPGAIATDIWRAAPLWARLFLKLVLPSARKGARPVVRLAAAPELEGVTGRYFDRMREVPPAPAAQSEADARRLWEIAERATT